MADKKISELPAATVPLAGTEKFEILQGGVNKQVDASDVGGSALTNGSGTTANGSSADLGGTLSADAIIQTPSFILAIRGTTTSETRLVIDGINNGAKILSFRTGNLKRWGFRVDGNETGSNANSDLAIRRYDDAGNLIDAVLTFDRSSGQGTFTQVPIVLTAAPGDNSTIAASTAFVQAALTTATVVSASTSTAGATITLDMDSKIQKIHVGSATFATAKVVAMSNTTNSLSFQFIFEVTNVAAVLTVPADWLMSTPDFDGADWTPPATGKYVFGGSWNGTNWYVNAAGPYV